MSVLIRRGDRTLTDAGAVRPGGDGPGATLSLDDPIARRLDGCPPEWRDSPAAVRALLESAAGH